MRKIVLCKWFDMCFVRGMKKVDKFINRLVFMLLVLIF